MKTLTRKNNYKTINIFFLIFIAMFIFLPQKAQAYEYAAPAWMDNEHIICVKYVPTTKKRLIPFLGDLSDARYILTKQEIQLVSMDINGNNEKIIKSIVIDYPRMSPKWQEEIFQGVLRVRMLAYCPQRKLIAFCTHGDVKGVFMINSDGTGAKKIAEVGGGMYFSPDGKYMQYTSKYKVWLYDLDTGEQKVLVENAVSGPWSPDGKKTFFSRKENSNSRYYNVFLYDFETKQESPVEALNKRNIGIIEDWSPDGTMIAAMQGGIYTLDGNSYSRGMEHLPYTIHWSPDGKHIIGDAGEKDDIWILNRDGTNLRALR